MPLKCYLKANNNTESYHNTHMHTHNHFTALLDFVWDYPGELEPESKL